MSTCFSIRAEWCHVCSGRLPKLHWLAFGRLQQGYIHATLPWLPTSQISGGCWLLRLPWQPHRRVVPTRTASMREAVLNASPCWFLFNFCIIQFHRFWYHSSLFEPWVGPHLDSDFIPVDFELLFIFTWQWSSRLLTFPLSLSLSLSWYPAII